MKNKEGFSMISLLIALILVTIGLTAMLSVSLESTTALIESRMRNEAIAVAESYMESAIDREVSASEGPNVEGLYTRSLAVESLSPSRRRISVIVHYTAPKGRERVIELVTIRRRL